MKHSGKFALATTISLCRKTEKGFHQILVEPGEKSPLGVLGLGCSKLKRICGSVTRLSLGHWYELTRLSLGHWYGLTRLSQGHWSGLPTRLSLGYVLSKVPVFCV